MADTAPAAPGLPRHLPGPGDTAAPYSGLTLTQALLRGMLRTTTPDATPATLDRIATEASLWILRDPRLNGARLLSAVGFSLAAIEDAAAQVTYAPTIHRTSADRAEAIATMLSVLTGIHWAMLDVAFDVQRDSWESRQFTANGVTTCPPDTWLTWLPTIIYPAALTASPTAPPTAAPAGPPPTYTPTATDYTVRPAVYTEPEDSTPWSAPHAVIQQPADLRDVIIGWVRTVPDVRLAADVAQSGIPRTEARAAYVDGVLRPGDPNVTATLRTLAAISA